MGYFLFRPRIILILFIKMNEGVDLAEKHSSPEACQSLTIKKKFLLLIFSAEVAKKGVSYLKLQHPTKNGPL